MRYSRVLSALALVGVVALTTTLVTQGGRSAAKPVRAAATRLPHAVVAKPSLRSVLQQQLQRLVATPPAPRAHAPSLNAPNAPVPCPVAGCSINPCVQFVQGGSRPAAMVSNGVQGAVAAPALPGGPRAQRCTRHALPHTFRVGSAVAAPASVSVSAPQAPSPRTF